MPITMQQVLAEAPDVAEALRAEGATAGAAAAATAERERIQSVFAQSMPGHEALINSLAFDGKTSGAEAAVAILGAEKQLRATALANRREDAPAATFAAAPAAPAKPAADANATPETEEKAKASWEASAELQGEFKAFSTYWAFCQSQSKSRK